MKLLHWRQCRVWKLCSEIEHCQFRFLSLFLARPLPRRLSLPASFYRQRLNNNRSSAFHRYQLSRMYGITWNVVNWIATALTLHDNDDVYAVLVYGHIILPPSGNTQYLICLNVLHNISGQLRLYCFTKYYRKLKRLPHQT